MTMTSPAAARDHEALLQRPLTSYYLVLVSTGLLLVVGLTMVFSASSVRSYADTGSSYAIAAKHGLYILLGLPLMVVASRMPVRVWRWLAYPALLVAVTLLVLVLIPGVGRSVDGATRWIPLPMGFNLQPSELAKLALALWGADLLVRKRKLLGEWKHLFVPLLPVTGLLCSLIMAEPDMGTTLVTVSVAVALLWVVGTPLRYFALFFIALVCVATMFAVSAEYRLRRVTSFLDPFADPLGDGYQAVQGLYAIASGGFLGIGLGGSHSKWSGGLPNAHTDYIFAIIGEELGLLGAATVLALVGTLIYGGIRIARRTTDPFARLAAAGVIAWLGTQSMVNIGAVLGVLPITGIPLPLVSFGGSAMIPTLVAIGMLLSFARHEPGAQKALGAPHRGRSTPQRTGSTSGRTSRVAGRQPDRRQ
ncbi:MAG TPA: putative lipid II flippase FtsW [Mycobacteriales bacterium]|nr:putative lipid II flippase FtsW [Mycobacteriales bacterium]